MLLASFFTISRFSLARPLSVNLEVVLHQPQQSRQRPEKDAFHFFTELFRKVCGIIDSIRRFSLCCQDQLPAEEAVAAIIQGNQIAVGEGQDAGVHGSPTALALPLKRSKSIFPFAVTIALM